jgi:histone-lysine N-methyltransferase SETMAR
MMLTVFFDRRGLLMADFLPQGQTINGNYYVTLLRQLREEIKSKRRGRLTRGIRLLHDNAPAHTCNVARAAIADCGFQTINHPAYSPDVAPSDYFLFSDLKRHLRGKHFDCDETLRVAILEHFDSHSVAFWHEAIDSLENRWQRVVESHGEYID